ncbi:MAG: ATP-dependent helicase [Longimicrobiaceae bacterium]
MRLRSLPHLYPVRNGLSVPPYLAELNPEQRAAALATQGPVLILAGAGSGKTRTLVHRTAHLIRGVGVAPRRILAVTFTNRAAAEMRERIAATVGSAARGATLCTFHALGARLLREFHEQAALPARFAIYATADGLAVVRSILAEEVHVAPTAGDDRYDPRRVLYRISGWKNALIGPQQAAREVAEGRLQGNRDDDYEVLAADVYPRYEQALRAAGACDFDDLLLRPIELLREHAEVRDACWRRWRYLMVDEYQDTNAAQLELARLLAGPSRNLCVVGDDDQSIYGWRGAEIRNIREFERHFPGATRVILEENYRSTQRILDAANAVVAHNRARTPKTLRTRNVPGPRVDVWEFPGGQLPAEDEEGAMVAREIGIRRYHERLAWSDFAVLYRANHQARPLEAALREANIPYRVVGGTSYFDRKEIADAAAYLRLVLNQRDEMALRRVINYPSRGIGRATQLALVERARRAGRTLWDVVREAARDGSFPAARADALAGFVALIERLGEELMVVEAALADAATGTGALERWVGECVNALDLEAAIRAEHPSERAGSLRVANLRDFVAACGAYETRVWSEVPLPDEEADWDPPSLAGFLQRVALLERMDERDDDDADAVALMTLHSAKGLEFSHVFIVGLEEELLPHARSVANVSAEGGDALEEERRLFYVGMTRARHRLTLSGCATRRRGGETVARQPSRFLAELPPELLDVRSATSRSSLSPQDSAELKENFFTSMRELLAE